MTKIYRQTESKRLYDALSPSIASGTILAYEDLSAKAGIDVRTNGGRGQFYRCAKEFLLTRKLWFECIPRVGYRVIEASEHGRSARRQILAARRRFRKGAAIVAYTDFDQLTAEQLKANADILARLSRLQEATDANNKAIQRILARVEPPRLPSPLIESEPPAQIIN